MFVYFAVDPLMCSNNSCHVDIRFPSNFASFVWVLLDDNRCDMRLRTLILQADWDDLNLVVEGVIPGYEREQAQQK